MMRVSFNGENPAVVAAAVSSGELALLRATSPNGTAYAILRMLAPDVALIEAVQGRGGTELTAAIVRQARESGIACESWVFTKSRATLAKRAGMRETGKTRISGSGREQLQVSTT